MSDTEVIWRNFSPRFGLAWDPAGDGRTAVRASVGTFYDFPSTGYQNPATAPPWSPRYTLSAVEEGGGDAGVDGDVQAGGVVRSPEHSTNTALATCSGSTSRLSRVRCA